MATRKNWCSNPAAKNDITGWTNGLATVERSTFVTSQRLRPTWSPTNTDNGNNEHNLGYDFSSDVAITANGLWWWHDGSTPPTTIRAMLWLTSTQTLVADSGTVSTTGYIASGWNFIPFTSTFSCVANTTYTVSAYSTGTYKYSSSDLAADQVDSSGHVRALAHTGRFANASGAVFPSSTWDGMFGIDLSFTSPSIPSLAPRSTGFRLTSTNAGSFVKTPIGVVVPGDIVTVSLYYKNSSSAFSFGKSIFVSYTRSSGGDVFPESFSTGTIGDIGSIIRVSFTTAPAPALATGIYLTLDNFNSSNVGFEFTGLLYEKVGVLDTYFDGDSLNSSWDGAPGNSTSTFNSIPPVPPGAFLPLL